MLIFLTETKPDKTLSVSRFFIDEFWKTFRLDRDRNGGGISIFVRKDISKLFTKHNFPHNSSVVRTSLIAIIFQRASFNSILCLEAKIPMRVQPTPI